MSDLLFRFPQHAHDGQVAIALMVVVVRIKAVAVLLGGDGGEGCHSRNSMCSEKEYDGCVGGKSGARGRCFVAVDHLPNCNFNRLASSVSPAPLVLVIVTAADAALATLWLRARTLKP